MILLYYLISTLIEILSMKIFLVIWWDHCLVCPNISLITLITESSLSGSVLIKLQSNSCSILLFAFLFHSWYFCCYAHFHQFLLRVYSHENINQSYNLTHSNVFACFLLQVNSLFSLALIVPRLSWHYIFWILISLQIYVLVLFYNPWLLWLLIFLLIKILLDCFFDLSAN